MFSRKLKKCNCPTVEHAVKNNCRRAGTLMQAPLWVICSGKCIETGKCTAELRDKYLRLWDSLPKKPKWKIILNRGWNFSISITKHAARGFPYASQENQAFRRSICDPCPWRNKVQDECRKCGCTLRGGKKQLFSKIAWASESCPAKYWLAVKGQTIFGRIIERFKNGWKR